MKVFLDTNVPMYASGKEHKYKKSCQDIILSASSGSITAYTDVEVFQEILYRFYYIKQITVGHLLFDSFFKIMEGFILPVTLDDILTARKLSQRYMETGLSPRDLIHTAVMLNNGIYHIITTDRDFNKVEGIKVIAPS